MAKYDVTYTCGHTGVIVLFGPSSQRQWALENKEGNLCPECYQKYLAEERDKANAAATRIAQEMELPTLTGTEKQVAWANTLRLGLIKMLEVEIEDIRRNHPDHPLTPERIDLVHTYIQYVISKTAASWFIDTRADDLRTIAKRLDQEITMQRTDTTPEAKDSAKEQADMKAAATVVPENCQHAGTVEITYSATRISARYEKNDAFREVVKAHGYEWTDGRWTRTITERTGTAEDRAAELGNNLLRAGFAVTILDEQVRCRAINAVYEPECDRWITASKSKPDILYLDFPRGGDLYEKLIHIGSAKWDRDAKSVTVSVSHSDEVEDAANLYGFKVTKAARARIDAWRDAQKTVTIAVPVTPEQAPSEDGLKKILKSDRSVIDDLKD